MIVAVDFDGTCVEHAYPAVGADVPGAESTLRHLVQKGHSLILWTMRSGPQLAEAERWFNDRQIPLFGVNRNETQSHWTDSPKVFANLYIDDAAFGAPLMLGRTGDRLMLNWNVIRQELLR